jgi:hypothetical protein
MISLITRSRAFAFLLSGILIVGCKNEPHPVTMKMGPAPGTPHKEFHASVRARPVFQDKKDYTILMLPTVKGRTVEILCDPTFSPWLKHLPRDRELAFTIWQTKRVAWHTDDGEESFSWDSEVETIKDGQKLLYDAAVCPIHQVRMERGEVRISHGTPSNEFFDAYEGFSGGPGFVWAGCVSMPGELTTEFGYKCDQCVAAYQRWVVDQEAKRLKSASAPPTTATPQ